MSTTFVTHHSTSLPVQKGTQCYKIWFTCLFEASRTLAELLLGDCRFFIGVKFVRLDSSQHTSRYFAATSVPLAASLEFSQNGGSHI